jgi:predicted nucleotidyltransferase
MTCSNKISWPSSELSAQELDGLLTRTVKEVESRPEIDGLIFMGSYVTQMQDENSDVDLVIIIRDENLAESVFAWKSYLSLLPTVLVMDELESLVCVATLETTSVGLVKIDYDFISTKNINDEVQKAMITQTGLCHGKILFDRSGHLARAYACSKSPLIYPKYPVTTMDQFIITTWSLIRMLNRGEVFEAYDILIAMRDPHILSLVMQLHNVPFENYRRIEEKIDVSWQQKIAHTFCDPVPDQISGSCIDLIKLYKLLWRKLDNKITEIQMAVLNVMVDALATIQTGQGKP